MRMCLADFIRGLPECSPKEIVQRGSAQGLVIKSMYVSYVRNNPPGKRRLSYEQKKVQDRRQKPKRRARQAKKRAELAKQDDFNHYFVDCIRGVLRLGPLYDQRSKNELRTSLKRFGGISYGKEVWLAPTNGLSALI